MISHLCFFKANFALAGRLGSLPAPEGRPRAFGADGSFWLVALANSEVVAPVNVLILSGLVGPIGAAVARCGEVAPVDATLLA